MPGEKSARKVPLTAKTLTDAKEEMGKRRTEAREGALPKGGVKPGFADYVRDYLDYHGSNQNGRKVGTVTCVTRAQVNILDANIIAGQRGWLARWRIPFRQIGRELAHRYDPTTPSRRSWLQLTLRVRTLPLDCATQTCGIRSTP